MGWSFATQDFQFDPTEFAREEMIEAEEMEVAAQYEAYSEPS